MAHHCASDHSRGGHGAVRCPESEAVTCLLRTVIRHGTPMVIDNRISGYGSRASTGVRRPDVFNRQEEVRAPEVVASAGGLTDYFPDVEQRRDWVLSRCLCNIVRSLYPVCSVINVGLAGCSRISRVVSSGSGNTSSLPSSCSRCS